MQLPDCSVVGTKKHRAWRDLALFIIDVRADYAGGNRKIDGQIARLVRRIDFFSRAFEQAKVDMELLKEN